MTEDGAEQVNLPGIAVVAILAGVSLAWTAAASALALLVAVAVWQALFALAWTQCLRGPGRNGALVLAGMAAAAADTMVSVWPHGRLGALAAVFALAMPVLFVHQLLRGAARVRVLESLGGAALLVLVEVALPSVLQLRHEFDGTAGRNAACAVVAVAAGALLVGAITDLSFATLRFDPQVPRSLLGVLGSGIVGAVLGDLILRNTAGFGTGRGLFLGAACGALIGLFAVAAAFIETAVPVAASGFARRGRPVAAVVLPIGMLAPIGYLLCLAVHG